LGGGGGDCFSLFHEGGVGLRENSETANAFNGAIPHRGTLWPKVGRKKGGLFSIEGRAFVKEGQLSGGIRFQRGGFLRKKSHIV